MGWLNDAKALFVPKKQQLWHKCKGCNQLVYVNELEKNLWVCPNCGWHFRIRAQEYIELIVDKNSFQETFAALTSADPLSFKDSKKYTARYHEYQKKTNQNDGVISGFAKIGGRKVSLAFMDFAFMGGSMGSVVGEKITRAIEMGLQHKIPVIVLSASGGARMQEGIFSLMQMAKTSALLAQLSEAKIPYISILTNPSTAGVMASYASLGDVIIAEPKALLGFAGPRVIKQTIGQDLPEGFQLSEFFLEHGMIDMIVERKNLRKKLQLILKYVAQQ